MSLVSFTFNGVDFGGASYAIEVAQGFRWPFVGCSPLQTDGLPAASKVINYRSGSLPAEVVFPCHVVGSSTSDLMTKLQSISTALSTPTSDALLVFSAATPRGRMGQWKPGVLDPTFLGTRAATFDVTFTCQPYMVDATASSHVNTGSGAILMPSAGYVSGYGKVPASIVIHNTGADVAAGALVLTSATGIITYADAVPSGTWVRFDTLYRQAYISADGATWTQVFGKVTGSPDWIPLVGGVQNSINVAGVTACQLTVNYTGRYS